MGIPDHLTCMLRNLYAGQEGIVPVLLKESLGAGGLHTAKGSSSENSVRGKGRATAGLPTYDGDLRDPLWWPRKGQSPCELLGDFSGFLSR